MEKEVYNSNAFRYAPFAYVCCKVRFSEEKQPESYLIVDLNSAFEKMTGEKTDEIIDKEFMEIITNIGMSREDWIDIFKEVIVNAKSKEIVRYLSPIEKWYMIAVFPSCEDHIVIIFYDISELMIYIKKIKQSHRKTKKISQDAETIFNGTNDAMFLVKVKDGEYRYIMNNKVHSELTGLSQETFKGKTPVELLGDELGKVIESNYRRCVEEKRTISYEETLKLPAGIKTWHTTLTPIWGRSGIKSIVGSSRDITEQKEAEEKLWLENQRFKAIVNSTEDIIYELDIEKRVVGIYGKWMENSGIRPLHFIGKNMREIFGPKRADIHENAIKRALQGEHVIYEWSIEIGDFCAYYQSSLSPILNKKGLVQGVVGIGRNITSLVNIRKELQTERELLKKTLLSIGDGVITTDVYGKINTMNGAAEEITGWSVEEVKGKLFSEVFTLMNEYTGEAVEDPVGKVLKEGKVVGLANHTVLINRYGKRIPIADSASPIKGEDGQVYGVVIVFRDVSYEKERQQKILYLSYHDVLTDIYNRRYLEEKIREADISQVTPYAVIMGDVNGLKLTNDIFGHEMGDRLLQRAVNILKKNSRKEDIIGRWGGDEFLILMPEANAEIAESMVKGIRQNCENDSDVLIKLSISLGYAVRLNPNESLMQTIKEAEEWLYKRKILEGKSYRNGIIEALLTILFEKGIEIEEHTKRVKNHCIEIGKRLKLSAKDLDDLSLLAVLHDIGKVGVSEAILFKPGSLTQDEWKEIKKHPEIGYRITYNTPELSGIAEYIFHHHERWDGNGYPLGLKGEGIPLLCRILSIADAYDVMTTDRVYRKAISKEEAIEEIMRNSGAQFDPNISKMFIDMISF